MAKKNKQEPYVVDDTFSIPDEIMAMSLEEIEAEIAKYESALKRKRSEQKETA